MSVGGAWFSPPERSSRKYFSRRPFQKKYTFTVFRNKMKGPRACVHRQQSAENSNVLQTMQWKLQEHHFRGVRLPKRTVPRKPRTHDAKLNSLVHACILPDPAIKSGNPAPRLRLFSLD